MNELAKGIPITPPPHEAAPDEKVPAKTITTWPVGTFVENLAVRADGTLVVSVVSSHTLESIRPADGTRRTLATFDASPTGLALLGEHLFVNVGEPGQKGWSIHRVALDGSSRKVLDVPEALFLNGSTFFRGASLLVADSILGTVFEVDVRTGEYRPWLAHESLRKLTSEPMIPGVNGVRSFRRHVYFTSTERALILRVPVTPEGDAGVVETLATRFLGDDFAFDVDGNLYVTTHVHNQVQRLSNKGERSVLAGPDEGMHGATSAAFGRTEADRRSLYVTTTGGIIGPIDGRVREAKLVRLEIGVEGAPPEVG
jgi:hypothetical protein